MRKTTSRPRPKFIENITFLSSYDIIYMSQMWMKFSETWRYSITHTKKIISHYSSVMIHLIYRQMAITRLECHRTIHETDDLISEQFTNNKNPAL